MDENKTSKEQTAAIYATLVMFLVALGFTEPTAMGLIQQAQKLEAEGRGYKGLLDLERFMSILADNVLDILLESPDEKRQVFR